MQEESDSAGGHLRIGAAIGGHRRDAVKTSDVFFPVFLGKGRRLFTAVKISDTSADGSAGFYPIPCRKTLQRRQQYFSNILKFQY